jgi:Fuc2NAc and GlcNAc transferase
MTALSILVLSATTFVAALLVTRFVRHLALTRQLLDHPNQRSSHSVSRPRLGGIGIFVPFLTAATASALLSGAAAGALPVLAGTAFISLIGFIDDLRPLAARWRFGFQVAAAVAVVAATGGTAGGTPWLNLLPSPLPPIVLVLWIVWVTNLYNFMDGIDGLAGGQAVLAGISIALAAFTTGATHTGSLALLLAVAASGFLTFNFPPATIFMGDVGSTAIGFFLATVPLLPGKNSVPLETVALALSLFILDATVTLVRRVAHGERWFEAHRTHFYQRPVVAGLPHRTVTLASYVGMAVVGACGALYPHAGADRKGLLVAAGGIVFLAAVTAVNRVEQAARVVVPTPDA